MKFTALLLAATALHAATFEERKLEMIDAYAHFNGPGDYGYAEVAAKLWRHEDPAWCSQKLEQFLKEPSGDMFWMYPVTAIAYLDQGQLTPSARAALRRSWKTYMPYRGDTENHFLLYYTSLYLMSQLWPDADWYTGKTSTENMEEARQWIEGWVKLTTTRGQGEYNSPHYMGVFLLPMSYLAAWAQDPAMKKRAQMMIEYLIADYAINNLDGMYVGAHSRVYEDQLVRPGVGVSADFGWLWFGLGHRGAVPANYALYYLLASAFEPPEILKLIATDRSKPYTHYERKRTRNRWRFNDELHGDVFKTLYMARDYAVGSDQGGVLQPIQQHSWDITWSVPDARTVNNTFFTNHPYSSVEELQTYFVFNPDGAAEGVAKSKKTYDSPDKLLGGSPYERIFQDRDAVIDLYNIPPGTRFPHVNGFFSRDLREVTEDAGWIFMRGGDSVYIACRPLQKYFWKPIEGGGRRLFSPYLKNGFVVQAAAASEYPDLASFAKAVKALPLEFTLEPEPRVKFRSLRGAEMQFRYSDPPSANRNPNDAMAPSLRVRDETVLVDYGIMHRVLNFESLTAGYVNIDIGQ